MSSLQRFKELVGLNRSALIEVSDATLTLRNRHNNKVLVFKAACTVTVPNYLDAGVSAVFVQDSASQVTFVAGSGATLVSRGNVLKTAAQNAVANILIKSNVGGSAAAAVLGGDISA